MGSEMSISDREDIAKSFEKDRVYDEKEVNAVIQEFYEDYCTIRRDMISEGIMERKGVEYKKR